MIVALTQKGLELLTNGALTFDSTCRTVAMRQYITGNPTTISGINTWNGSNGDCTLSINDCFSTDLTNSTYNSYLTSAHYAPNGETEGIIELSLNIVYNAHYYGLTQKYNGVDYIIAIVYSSTEIEVPTDSKSYIHCKITVSNDHIPLVYGDTNYITHAAADMAYLRKNSDSTQYVQGPVDFESLVYARGISGSNILEGPLEIASSEGLVLGTDQIDNISIIAKNKFVCEDNLVATNIISPVSQQVEITSGSGSIYLHSPTVVEGTISCYSASCGDIFAQDLISGKRGAFDSVTVNNDSTIGGDVTIGGDLRAKNISAAGGVLEGTLVQTYNQRYPNVGSLCVLAVTVLSNSPTLVSAGTILPASGVSINLAIYGVDGWEKDTAGSLQGMRFNLLTSAVLRDASSPVRTFYCLAMRIPD